MGVCGCGRKTSFSDLSNQGLKTKNGQMKIMQMAFMIIGVFIFFVLVGLFFMIIMFNNVGKSAEDLAKKQAISSLEGIAAMSELHYDSREELTVDEDKLRVMAGGMGENMSEFWPVASLEVYKVYPTFGEVIKCPAVNCNYYEIMDSGQRNVEKFSSYVSICKRVREKGRVYDKCEIGKLVAGMKIREDFEYE